MNDINYFGNFLFDITNYIFIKCKGLRPTRTGKITENIFAINTGVASFYLYQKGDAIIAIDSGFGQNIIKREFSKLNLSPHKMCAVFLTHSDFDHAGGLSFFEGTDIYLSVYEEPLILPKIPREYGFAYNKRISRPYKLLRHGDEIHIGEIKIQAIETPGHMPGSMSYLIDDTYLFVGDAFKVIRGKIRPAGFNMDKMKQMESIKNLSSINGVRMAFNAHGEYSDRFNEVTELYVSAKFGLFRKKRRNQLTRD